MSANSAGSPACSGDLLRQFPFAGGDIAVRCVLLGHQSAVPGAWSQTLATASKRLTAMRGRLVASCATPGEKDVRGARDGKHELNACGQGLILIAALLAVAGRCWRRGRPQAQPGQQQDPFGGQFGAMGDSVHRRAEAAHLAQLMSDALAALQPQRPGQQDVYLIVASLWGQPVFENEAMRGRIHSASRIFTPRAALYC